MAAQTLIAIDPAALQSIRDELAALRRSIEAVNMTAQPEWMTVNDYAAFIGKSRKTVLRYIEAGQIETAHMCGARMVRVQSSRFAKSSAVSL